MFANCLALFFKRKFLTGDHSSFRKASADACERKSLISRLSHPFLRNLLNFALRPLDMEIAARTIVGDFDFERQHYVAKRLSIVTSKSSAAVSAFFYELDFAIHHRGTEVSEKPL